MSPVINSILVAVDFGPCSERALQLALGLAQKLGASIHLLHVVELSAVMPPGWALEYFPPNFEDLQAEAVGDATRRMERYRTQLEAAHVPVTTAVVTGHTAARIAERAGDGGADLVVMGTHGRSGCSRLLMGSVAEGVMRKAPCPVLTVRDTKREAGTTATPHAA